MHKERGSAALELVIAFPAIVGFLLFVVLCGQFSHARGEVDAVARDAARAAVIERTPAAATAAAQTAANDSMQSEGIACRGLTVNVDTARFMPGGSVTVDVSCSADLSKVALLKLPGSKTFTSRFVAPIDLYRGVS